MDYGVIWRICRERLPLIGVLVVTAGIPGLADADVEPNDRLSQAQVLDSVADFSGVLDVRDTDYYRLTFPDGVQVRDIEVEFESERHFNFCIFSADQERLKCHTRNATSDRFENVAYEGEFFLSVGSQSLGAEPVPYTVSFSPPRAPAESDEVEPNDQFSVAMRASPGKWFGTLPVHDKDVYRITVDRSDLWELEVIGAGLHSVDLTTAKGNQIASRSPVDGVLKIQNLRLSPGDYYVTLHSARAGGERSYTFSFDTALPDVARPPGRLESEPNDHQIHANNIPAREALVGLVSARDADHLRFSVPGHSRVRVTATPPPGGTLYVALDGERLNDGREVDTPIEYVGDVVAGDHYLKLTPGRVETEGFYTVTVEQLNLLADADLAGIDVSLDSTVDTVAAYWPQGQRFSLEATVANNGASSQDVEVVAAANASAWRLIPDVDALQLAPGEQKSVNVDVEVLADVPADRPVLMSLGVKDASGAVSSATWDVDATCVAPPVESTQLWSLPEVLLGRVNAAYSRFGAKILTERRGVETINDGVVTPGGATRFLPGEQIRIELAGDAASTILGFVLHPFARDAKDQLREFEVATSLDGETFTPVMTDALRSDVAEQAFVLPEPVTARFVELTLKSTQGARHAMVGEFKVLVEEGIADLLGKPVNIAENELGGHDVYSDPFTGAACCREALSTSDADGQFTRGRGRQHEWVMGFTHNRAALIDRIHWQDVNRGREHFKEVTVYTTMDGALGPWEELAVWKVDLDADFAMSLELDEPRWARFVKFVTNKTENPVAVPQQISIFERVEAGADGRSILGEWGWNSREAVYEYLHPPVIADTRGGLDGGNTKETAYALRADEPRGGRVMVGEEEDWYVVELPDGSNQLVLTLKGTELIEYAYEVQNAAGEILEPAPYEIEGGLQLKYLTAPGKHYIRIFEPPRSVIFSWDTSGSVGAYIDVIDQAMREFALDVQVGREEVNLIPFQDGAVEVVLDEWTGNPAAVSAAVVNIKHRRNSSNSETALLKASEELKEREGTRAVLFITDALTDGYASTAPLWQSLKESKPRIFAFEISSRGSHEAQHMMESFADVNRGFYEQSRTAGQLQVGLDRAACLLRRPKSYELVATFEVTEDVPPGRLVVTDSSLEQRDAVELILDASGSMFRKLDGRFRYEVAKDVLVDLVENAIPEDMLFALRVFGNREPRVCRTDLEVELGKLNRDAAVATIRAIEPQPFAGTPIAESLKQVPVDLADASGRKTVVLVTDGEESCDGDVEKAIAALKSSGVNPQVNVIGFDFDAEDKEAARAQFRRWAELGEGRYFDAGDAEELAESIQSAISGSTEFEVLQNGIVVASGFTDGTELTLPAGAYEVRAKTNPDRSKTVYVKSEVLVEAELPQPD